MRRLIAAIIVSIGASFSYADPVITNHSGSAVYGSTIIFTGSGFGSKPLRERQTLFANFKGGVQPSTWSHITAWTDLSNFEYKTTNCDEGGGCGGETTGWDTTSSPNKVTAAVLHDDIGYSGKFSVSWMWKSDAASTTPDYLNLKTYRWYPSSLTKNNTYGGQTADGGFVNNTEKQLDGIGNSTSFDTFYTVDIEPTPSEYKQVEMLFQLNSAGNATDGVWKIIQGGSTVLDKSTWRSNTSADTASAGRYRQFYPVHMQFTSGGTGGVPIGAGHFVRYENVVADTSWCAVWVTTVSTNVQSATKYFLPIVAWNSTEVRAVYATEKYSSGTQLYGYIRANDGTVNSSGRSIISASSAGGTPPTISTFTVSSGPASGLNSIGITGTGFSGSSVIFGTVTAPSTITNNSTSLTVTVPAHDVGLVDVTVRNLDEQAITSTGSYRFNSPPVVTSMSPSTGRESFTSTHTVFGKSFVPGQTVKIGTTTVSFTINSSTAMIVTAPTLPAGTYNLTVTSTDTQSGSLVSTYTATPRPSFISANPISAIRTGGVTIALSGANFANGFSVKAGTTPFTSPTFTNSASVSVVSPSVPAGSYSIYFLNPDGQDFTAEGAITFTDPGAPPSIVSPGSVLPFIR